MLTFEEWRDKKGFPVTSTQQPLFRECWETAQHALLDPPPETKAEFALRVLVIKGTVTQVQIDSALQIASKFTAHTGVKP